MKIIQLGYFRKATSQSPGLHETLATAAKAKRNTQSVFLFVSDEILFLLAACLAEHFSARSRFFFAGCSKEPRMPRTPVI